jgi:hypothetical protein
MWDFVIWTCALGAMQCGTVAAPDAATIQSVYEREAANGSSLHDKGLRVIEATCNEPANDQYFCQVTFLSNDDPRQQLYFDVVSVVRAGHEWQLRSGLCRR